MSGDTDIFNLAPSIREALLGDAAIVALLGQYKGEPSVHTRRPAPQGATYPMAMVSPDIASTDTDFLSSSFWNVLRDVTFYGEQPKDYRAVEQAAYLARRLFHSNRFSISPPGIHVVDIRCTGPIPAAVDDEKLVGRAVTLAIRFQPLSE